MAFLPAVAFLQPAFFWRGALRDEDLLNAFFVAPRTRAKPLLAAAFLIFERTVRQGILGVVGSPFPCDPVGEDVRLNLVAIRS